MANAFQVRRGWENVSKSGIALWPASVTKIGVGVEWQQLQPSLTHMEQEQAATVAALARLEATRDDLAEIARRQRQLIIRAKRNCTNSWPNTVDDHLQPLTPTGAFHIRRLRLNRPQLIALRQARRCAMQQIACLTELETQIVAFRRDIAALEGQLETWSLCWGSERQHIP